MWKDTSISSIVMVLDERKTSFNEYRSIVSLKTTCLKT